MLLHDLADYCLQICSTEDTIPREPFLVGEHPLQIFYAVNQGEIYAKSQSSHQYHHHSTQISVRDPVWAHRWCIPAHSGPTHYVKQIVWKRYVW